MIRKARPSDVNEVVTLIMAAIGELIELYTGERDENKAAPILAQFYLQKGTRFSSELINVYEQAGRLAGMILCYRGQEAPELYAPVERFRSIGLGHEVKHELEAEPDEYYIDALAVAPQYQRQGIASSLMKQAEQDAIAAGLHKIALLVDINNDTAKNVYVRQGYCSIGQKMLLQHPYWHMVKPL